MIKTNIKLLFIITLVGFLSACNKDKEAVVTDITTTDVENVETILDEVGFLFEGNDLATEAKNGRTGSCFVVTDGVDDSEIVITFEDGCIADDGKARSGKITYSWIGLDGEAGFGSTIVYENFSVDGYTIDGTFSIKDFTFSLEDTTMSYTMVVDNMTFTDPDGKFSKLSETLTITANFTDEGSFEISGNIAGTTKEGNKYTALITKELILKVTCEEGPVSGTFVFTINDDAPMTLDYGDGTCDSIATLTRGDFSKTIDFSDD